MSSAETPDINISSFAAPTPEDIAKLEGLSEAQLKLLIAQEIEKGIDSGISEMTMQDIWTEALRRVKAKAHAPGAL